MTEIGECVSIFVPKDKKEQFWNNLKSAGYETNGNGVLNYILETEIDESEDEETFETNIFKEWVKKNPEQWETIKEKGSVGIRSLLSKLSQRF